MNIEIFLVQKDPFPKLKRDQKKCLVCGSEKSENLKIACNSNNVGYKLECDTCLDRGQIRSYEGESSRSARIRGAEHLADLEKKRPKSVLLKHKLNEHIDEEMRIRMEITRKFKDPLTRQANEAVRIKSRSTNPGELLNSKSEFNHPPLARVVVEKRSFGKNAVKNSKNGLQHQSKHTLKSTLVNNSEDSFLFGVEENTRPDHDSNCSRVVHSSNQEIHLESTMLTL